MAKVYVATANIPPGTFGKDILAKHMVALETLPKKEVRTGAFASEPQLHTLSSIAAIPKRSQLLRSEFVTPSVPQISPSP